MITLELTEEQAKTILIVMGNCAGVKASRGVYQMVRSKLRVIGPVPDPRIYENTLSIVVDDEMIESIRTM